MAGFGFDSKGIIGAINTAAKDIVDNLKISVGGDIGATAEGIMGDTKKQINEEFGGITKQIFGFLFNPLKAMSKTTGKLLKKTFGGPKAKAMGGFMKNIGSIMGTMLGPIGFILAIFEKLGVFEPILEIVNDLIEMLGAKMLEKLMPSFEKLFDIMLSDDVMSLIDALAEIFAAMIAPLMELVITLLPVFLVVLTPLIGLLAELMPLLTLPSMIIAKLIATLVKLPGFQRVLEAITGALMIAVDAISWFVDFVITAVNDFMNIVTLGAWEDIPSMGSEAGGSPTAAGELGASLSPANNEMETFSRGTSININVEGDIMGEEMVDKLISEIELNTRLGMMI